MAFDPIFRWLHDSIIKRNPDFPQPSPCAHADDFAVAASSFRYCSVRFACKFPTWELPVRGHVRELVTESCIDGQVLRGDRVCHVPLPGSAGDAGVLCEGRVLGGVLKIRLNRKNTSTPCKTW